MTRRYTPEEKAEALALLQANRGNIALTHVQTTVPERTLRHWRRQQWLKQQAQLPLPPPTPPRQQQEDLPEFEDDATALKFLREQIIQELLQVAVSLKDSFSVTTPYQRVLVLSQLLDRLIKLDNYIPRTEHEQVIRIEYQYPDGLIYDRPPWADRDGEWSPMPKPDSTINENETDYATGLALDDHFPAQGQNDEQ
jgi:transposase-like protein